MFDIQTILYKSHNLLTFSQFVLYNLTLNLSFSLESLSFDSPITILHFNLNVAYISRLTVWKFSQYWNDQKILNYWWGLEGLAIKSNLFGCKLFVNIIISSFPIKLSGCISNSMRLNWAAFKIKYNLRAMTKILFEKGKNLDRVVVNIIEVL